jgi:hypothetical protein
MPCGPMRHLIQHYIEAATAHAELKHARHEVQREVGIGEFLHRVRDARSAREDAWRDWEAHVAGRSDGSGDGKSVRIIVRFP